MLDRSDPIGTISRDEGLGIIEVRETLRADNPLSRSAA
jgi:hypothetical protein